MTLFRVGLWPLGPGPLGGPAHQGRGGPLGAQHTKVEVRVAHFLGMHSFDDFRVSGREGGKMKKCAFRQGQMHIYHLLHTTYYLLQKFAFRFNETLTFATCLLPGHKP